MCCGDEHKNDPSYARSRCSAGILLCNEITYCVLIIAISIVSAVAALALCLLAADGSSSSSVSNKWVAVSPEQTCSASTDCSAGQLCYGKCEMAGAKNTDYTTWSAEMRDTTLGGTHEAVTNDRLCPWNSTFGGSCASSLINSSTTFGVYVAHSRYADISCSRQLCYEKETSRRRLRETGETASIFPEDPAYVKYMPVAFQKFVRDSKIGLEAVLQNPKLSIRATGYKGLESSRGRYLLSSEDQDEIKAAGKAGCDAAALLGAAFWGSIVFGICGIVFSAMQSCVCCKGGCGGYRGQHKMFAIYGAVASVWQLIPTIMYLIFYLAVSRVVKVLVDFGIDSTIFEGILTVLLVCVLLAVTLFLTRAINAAFSWIAAKSPHSGDVDTATVVQAPVIVQQAPVTQVQMVKQEAYVVADPQEQA